MIKEARNFVWVFGNRQDYSAQYTLRRVRFDPAPCARNGWGHRPATFELVSKQCDGPQNSTDFSAFKSATLAIMVLFRVGSSIEVRPGKDIILLEAGTRSLPAKHNKPSQRYLFYIPPEQCNRRLQYIQFTRHASTYTPSLTS